MVCFYRQETKSLLKIFQEKVNQIVNLHLTMLCGHTTVSTLKKMDTIDLMKARNIVIKKNAGNSSAKVS